MPQEATTGEELPTFIPLTSDGLYNDSNYSTYGDAGTSDFVSALDHSHIRWIFIVLYTAVFACCFLGNLFVILVVVRHRKMRTITNFFLANLALADLCVGVFCVLPNLSTQLFPVWHLGKVLCKLYYFVQAMSYTASIMILTAISIERYFAIIHPMRSKQLTTLCLLGVIVLVIWTVAASCAVPYLLIFDTIDIQGMQFCMLIGPFNSRAYVTSSFLLWYVIPLVLMSVMYAKISVVLWRTSKPDNFETNSGFKTKRPKRPKHKKHGVRLVALGRSRAADTASAAGSKPVIYVSNVNTSASSDEATQDEAARHALYPTVASAATVGSEAPYLQVASSGYDSRSECSAPDDGKEPSSDEAADYEDDWPTSDKKRRDEYPMKQIYTFKNPSYSSICSVCQTPMANSHSGSAAKCACAGKAANTSVAISGNRQVASGVNTRVIKNRKATRKTENALVARRRVIRLLIAVIVSFALCVLPYHVRLLWMEWSTPTLSFGETLLPPITFLLYYFNSALNPILYAFLSDNFRRSLKEVLCCTVDENSRRRSMRSTMSVKTMNSTI